jgi:hypothetical protein
MKSKSIPSGSGIPNLCTPFGSLKAITLVIIVFLLNNKRILFFCSINPPHGSLTVNKDFLIILELP